MWTCLWFISWSWASCFNCFKLPRQRARHFSPSAPRIFLIPYCHPNFIIHVLFVYSYLLRGSVPVPSMESGFSHHILSLPLVGYLYKTYPNLWLFSLYLCLLGEFLAVSPTAMLVSWQGPGLHCSPAQGLSESILKYWCSWWGLLQETGGSSFSPGCSTELMFN